MEYNLVPDLHKKYHKLKLTIKVLMINAVVLLSLISSSCSTEKKDHWTIMIYMAADNNLSDQAIQDIIEMEQAVLPSGVNVIIQLDPNDEQPDPQARRYKLKHNNLDYIASPVIEYMGNIDSGNYRNLADFVNFSVKEYPANKYALIIWSHGSGWTRSDDYVNRGICPDQTHFNQISVAKGQLRRAFEMFSQKLNVLIFDACLMFTLEVLTEVYQYTEFVVGSENLMPYEGLPYKEILNNWQKSITASTISNNVVELFIQSHLPGGSQNPNDLDREVSMSAMNSAKLPLLLNSLATFVSASVDNNYALELVQKARKNSFGFHVSRTETDIKEFMINLKSLVDQEEELTNELQSIINIIDRVFVSQASLNLPENIGTATVWLPTHLDYLKGSGELYSNLKFAQLTTWISFLEWFLEKG